MLHHLPRFRKARKSLAQLADRETWPRDRIAAFQLERLNALWRRSVGHSPYYRQLQQENNLPDRFSEIDQFTQSVPVLSKQVVREQPNLLLADNSLPGKWHVTSGSTGIPTRIFESHEDHRRLLRYQYRFLDAWGVSFTDAAAFLWCWTDPKAVEPCAFFRRSMERCRDMFRRRLRLPAYDLSPEVLRRHWKKMHKFQPRSLYAFTSAAYVLAREARHFDPPPSSLNLVVLSGEPVTPVMQHFISKIMQVPVANQYGCTECAFIAGSWPDGMFRVREDACLVECLPRPDGMYQILLTVFDNGSFPLLRYEVGDLTDAPLEYPQEGFARMGTVVGRNDDVVFTRRGRCLHPTRVDAVFEASSQSAVRRYRLHQQRDGTVKVTLELESSASFDREPLRLVLEQLFEGFPVELLRVARLPAGPAGKFRTITSEIRRSGVALD